MQDLVPPAAPDLALTPPLPTVGGARHLLVPWCASPSDTGERALAQLPELPGLQGLVGALTQRAWLAGDEYQGLPPHERLLARWAGWSDAPDAPVPWAALWAHLDGVPVQAGQAWGLITPAHWLMGREHLTLVHPEELALDEAGSRALFEAVKELFESEGWTLHWAAPLRWYARHTTALSDLPTASLDRVLGRNPDVWMTMHAQARPIRRLQSEVQMLLHGHPLNEAREAAGALPMNSFWLSGCGTLEGEVPDCGWPVRLLQSPREALLRSDWPGWIEAWRTLDAQVLQPALADWRQDGQPLTLTLCGERQAVTLTAPLQKPGLGPRFKALLGLSRGPTEADVRHLLSQL